MIKFPGTYSKEELAEMAREDAEAVANGDTRMTVIEIGLCAAAVAMIVLPAIMAVWG